MKHPRKLPRALALGVIAGAGLVGTLATPAQASTVIGSVYQHPNYSGSRQDHFVTNNGWTCTATTGDVDVEWAKFDDPWWNDRVSSFKNYANCYTKIYEHQSYGGASLGYVNDQATLGLMEDETSSIRYS